MWFKLPESTSYLEAAEARGRGEGTRSVRSADVVKGRYLRVSIGLWVASFIGLLLVLNVGAIIGLIIAGHISDSRGNEPTVLLWFGLAAVFLALLSIRSRVRSWCTPRSCLPGMFVFSAQVLVYAFVAHLYPTEIRGTALGMAAGVGRIGAIIGPFLGGAMVTAGVAYPWGFYAFAVAAVLAVLALVTVPAHMRKHASV